MRKLILAAMLGSFMVPTAAVQAQGAAQERREERRENRQERREDRREDRWREGRNYDWNRPDRRAGGYYADNYYRANGNYRERRLGRNDRIYRGRDNRYYCRRPDGTTGLIIGGAVGGLLGNSIASGGSNTLGTLLGAGAGALLGREVDRGGVRCR